MSHLIEVAFKGNRKDFFRWDGEDPPRLRAPIIVEGDRGEDLGHVHATGELATQRFAGVAHGAALFGPGTTPERRALRLATPAEEQRAGELDALNEDARRRSMERVRHHGLVMKISDADWQWDRRKLTLYFTAEKRVDFRALVRDLASLFRTRIELKQIGVRDEAKRLDGIGRCGRQYCSASWLPELRPVNLSVAKDQRLSLNPTQISGACGRLMCSLRYEHEFYVQQRKRFPKEGKILVTARGEEKVLANDIFRERVTLRGLDGETRVVALLDLRQELESLGADGGPFSVTATGTFRVPGTSDAAEEPTPLVHDELSGEVVSMLDTIEHPIPRELRGLIPLPEPPAAAREGERRGGERREGGDRRATAPVPAPALVPPAEPTDDGEEGDEDDGTPEGAAAVDAEGNPVPRRRRRGRRGGRRNRNRREGNVGAPLDQPADDEAGADDGSAGDPA